MNDALRDAWLAEMWTPCPEVPRHHREEKRKADRVQQREIEEWEFVNTASTPGPLFGGELSTGCAETGGEEHSEVAA